MPCHNFLSARTDASRASFANDYIKAAQGMSMEELAKIFDILTCRFGFVPSPLRSFALNNSNHCNQKEEEETAAFVSGPNGTIIS